jgi:hypothetical protein
MNATGPKQGITWRTLDSDRFVDGALELPARIVNEEAWVAVASKSTFVTPLKGLS